LKFETGIRHFLHFERRISSSNLSPAFKIFGQKVTKKQSFVLFHLLYTAALLIWTIKHGHHQHGHHLILVFVVLTIGSLALG
jgi:uncharacterized membrane protein